MRTYKHEPWLTGCLQPEQLKQRIAHAVRFLDKHKIEYDTIAFRGMSGALYASALALATGKNLIMVRKSGAETHSGYGVEGFADAQRYLIVDDLIDSGSTCRAIERGIEDFAPNAVCVGGLFLSQYQTERLDEWDSMEYVYESPNCTMVFHLGFASPERWRR